MKSSSILGIIGIVFGFLGGLLALMFSALSTNLMPNAMVAIFASILGILGLWLSGKDNKIAAAQYLVVGIGLLIAISAFGILGFIFFIIAALLSFRDKDQINSVNEVAQ